jgi:hypothetical protein
MGEEVAEFSQQISGDDIPLRNDLLRLARVPLLQQIVRSFSRRVVFAEIGVWKGELAEALMREEAIHEYHMVDPWRSLQKWDKPFNVSDGEFSAVFAEAIERTNFAAERRRIHRGTMLEVRHSLPDEGIDVAYIDGDHTCRGIVIDLVSMFPKLRPGGFLIGDDATPNPWQHGSAYEPTMVWPVCRYLAEAWGEPLFMTSHNQFIIHKSQGRGFSFHDATNAFTSDSLRSVMRPC